MKSLQVIHTGIYKYLMYYSCQTIVLYPISNTDNQDNYNNIDYIMIIGYNKPAIDVYF